MYLPCKLAGTDPAKKASIDKYIMLKKSNNKFFLNSGWFI